MKTSRFFKTRCRHAPIGALVGLIGISMDVSAALSRNDCCTALITPEGGLRWTNHLFTRKVGRALSNLDHFLTLDDHTGMPIVAVLQSLRVQQSGGCCLRGTWIKDGSTIRRISLNFYTLRESAGTLLGYLLMIEAADSFAGMADGGEELSFQSQDEIIRLRHAILG